MHTIQYSFIEQMTKCIARKCQESIEISKRVAHDNVQNTRMLTIANNFVAHNAGGGVRVNTTTKDNEVALYANITNNVIIHNTHGEALQLEGKCSRSACIYSDANLRRFTRLR